VEDTHVLEGDYDYGMVGAGTAACLRANNRLSEDPATRVLLLQV